MTTIHGFDIWPVGDLWTVTDTDGFNNWGSKTFLLRSDAVLYAEWAHAFKTGRTMREFRQ